MPFYFENKDLWDYQIYFSLYNLKAIEKSFEKIFFGSF